MVVLNSRAFLLSAVDIHLVLRTRTAYLVLRMSTTDRLTQKHSVLTTKLHSTDIIASFSRLSLYTCLRCGLSVIYMSYVAEIV